MKLYVNYPQLSSIREKTFRFFFSTLSWKSRPPLFSFCFFSRLSRSPAAVPMFSPMELVSDEISGEMTRSGDDDPIPSQFIADSFSQVLGVARAPRNLHGVVGRGLEVGGGVGGGLQGPSPALHVGLSRGNSLGVRTPRNGGWRCRPRPWCS
jgi:hypothetical protein